MHEPDMAPLWLQPNSLKKAVNTTTWERGQSLFVHHKVQWLNIEPEGAEWLVEGDVQGSAPEPYAVTVKLNRTPQGEAQAWSSLCTCPVGHQCKHAVAVLLGAVAQGHQLLQRARERWTPEQHADWAHNQAHQASQQARQKAEAQLNQWLGALAQAEAPAGGDAVRKDQYIYLLSTRQTPQGPCAQLRVMQSSRKVNGDWGKPRGLTTPSYYVTQLVDNAPPADRDALRILNALSGGGPYSSGGWRSPVLLVGAMGELALQLAAQSGRLYVEADKSTLGTLLAWGPELTLDWAWNEVNSSSGSDEPGWQLRPCLSQPSAHLCHNIPLLYWDEARGCCGTVRAEGVSPAQLPVLLQAPVLQADVLKTHQSVLATRLGAVPLPPVLPQLRVVQGLRPVPHLHLSAIPPEDTHWGGLVLAQLVFHYGEHTGWWDHGQATVVLDDGVHLLHRDLHAEATALDWLYEQGLCGGDGGAFGLPGEAPQQLWLHWADTGYQALRDAGFEVALDDSLHGWVQHADTVHVALQGRGDDDSTSPWFDLSLGIDIDGQRHNILPWLPSLIAAARLPGQGGAAGEGTPELPPYVYGPAPGGTGFVRVPTEALRPWLAALLELVGDRQHNFEGERLQLTRLDALRASAALGQGAVWEGAQALRDMVQQLQGHTELPQVALPAGLRAELRPYQQQGVNWLQFLRSHGLSGILADDMGLGKTLQTLAHILLEKEAGRLTLPALVIAPVSLMGNWQREAQRFCPDLRCLVLHGQERHEAAEGMAEHDLIIVPYSLLQRDRERWLQQAWHLVVLDEAQNIKNASTQAAQVAGELQARHRVCLSGTPMENHLGELWSLFHFLMPGFLGSQQRFKELFRNPIEKQGDPERLAQLRKRITPFMLRRTKALVAHELPPKVETVMRVEMAGKQADLYETIRLGMEKAVREALDTKGLAKSQIAILDALLKLRQVCCDPQLLSLEAAKKVKTSAKLEQLMTLLPEMLAEGRRVLLFSQFTSMLTLIEAELKKRQLPWVKLTGQTQKRDEAIQRFTSGEVPLFLISLKAGGVGLNLPQADTVIHYDPWWNPAVENQATDRAHRIGQTQSVWVVKLVAQGTIEERMLELQARKAALADSMYSGTAARKQPMFNENDLAELFKPLG